MKKTILCLIVTIGLVLSIPAVSATETVDPSSTQSQTQDPEQTKKAFCEEHRSVCILSGVIMTVTLPMIIMAMANSTQAPENQTPHK